MYRQPEHKPQARKFRDPEDVRRFEERLRNLERLIRYNNKRALLGLPLVPYPESLLDWEQSPDQASHRDRLTIKTR